MHHRLLSAEGALSTIYGCIRYVLLLLLLFDFTTLGRYTQIYPY